MMKIVAAAICGSVFISGCASMNNDGTLREYDLRKKMYEYVDTEMYIELPAVQRQLYKHKEACDVEVVFSKDHMQVHFATILYGPPEATELKDKVMFDLTSYGTGKTSIKGYTYYVANKDLARQFVNVLTDPTTCPQGINAKIK